MQHGSRLHTVDNIMRIGNLVIVAAATLLVGTSALPADSESVTKRYFTSTSPETNSTCEGVNNKKDKLAGSSNETDSAEDESARQEERAGLSEAVSKLGKITATNADSAVNKILSAVFKKLVPSDRQVNDLRKGPARHHPWRVEG
ncbi:hypothetical protein KRP22_012400 [Phytophthora ramorum]|nr:hypothetical protein KRP22_13203 [Phytophthora ramorum]